MRRLQRNLAQMFSPRPRRASLSRVERVYRAEALSLAGEIGATLEPLPGGGRNVWPPLEVYHDPYEGDHYTHDWSETLDRLRVYQPLSRSR
jgi:hypothetical protein